MHNKQTDRQQTDKIRVGLPQKTLHAEIRTQSYQAKSTDIF